MHLLPGQSKQVVLSAGRLRLATAAPNGDLVVQEGGHIVTLSNGVSEVLRCSLKLAERDTVVTPFVR